MSRVSLVIDMPAPEYRALVAAASTRGVQAHVLVEQLVQHALRTSRPAPSPLPEPAPKPKYVPRPMPLRSRAMVQSDRDAQWVAVERLHGQGLNDSQIAAAVGIAAATVRRRRLQLKLPAVAGPGRPKRTSTNAAPAAEESKS